LQRVRVAPAAMKCCTAAASTSRCELPRFPPGRSRLPGGTWLGVPRTSLAIRGREGPVRQTGPTRACHCKGAGPCPSLRADLAT
jgi:hypothetical protein